MKWNAADQATRMASDRAASKHMVGTTTLSRPVEFLVAQLMDLDGLQGVTLSLHRGVRGLRVGWSKDVYCLNPQLWHNPPGQSSCRFLETGDRSVFPWSQTDTGVSESSRIHYLITYWQSPFEIDGIIPTLQMRKTTKGFERQGQMYSTFFNIILIFSLVLKKKKTTLNSCPKI